MNISEIPCDGRCVVSVKLLPFEKSEKLDPFHIKSLDFPVKKKGFIAVSCIIFIVMLGLHVPFYDSAYRIEAIYRCILSGH